MRTVSQKPTRTRPVAPSRQALERDVLNATLARPGFRLALRAIAGLARSHRTRRAH